jgi:hypothetical protein
MGTLSEGKAARGGLVRDFTIIWDRTRIDDLLIA